MSTGGGCGFIHLWALSDEPLMLRALESRDEEYYYNGFNNGRTRKDLEDLLPVSDSLPKISFWDRNCRISFRNDDFCGMIHAIRIVPFVELSVDTPVGQMVVDDVRDDGGSVPTEDKLMKEVNRRLLERKKEADCLRDLLIAQSIGFSEDLKADFGSRTDTFKDRMCSEVNMFHAKFERDNKEIVSIIGSAYKDVTAKLTNVLTEVQDASKSSRTNRPSQDLQSFLESMSRLLSKPGGDEK